MINSGSPFKPGRRLNFPAAFLTLFLVLLYLLPVGSQLQARKGRDAVAIEYDAAKSFFEKFLQAKKLHKYRDKWLACIDRFLAIQEKHPQHWRADDAMYMAAQAYRGLYAQSYMMDDLNTSIMTYRRLIARYPGSNLADDGQFLIGEMYEKEKADKQRAYSEYRQVITDFPKGDMVPPAKKATERLKRYAPPKQPPKPEPKLEPKPLPPLSPQGKVWVKEVSHYSSDNYTRIVIHTDRKIDYVYQQLAKNEQAGLPRRLYLDLKGTERHSQLPDLVPIKDGLLKQIRTGQHTADVCRVVLDIESISTFSVFSLEEPFRIVIDVTGETPEDTVYDPAEAFDRIVLDPGHGGKDPGASYYGRREKDLILTITKKVKSKLQEKLPTQIVLSRDADNYIPLVERTALANRQQADLFVSIHLNASSRNSEAVGVETYYLSTTRDPEALALAAAENAVSESALVDINQYIELGDIALRARIEESRILAVTVHKKIVHQLGQDYHGVESRGVRRAPFYVLVGAQMPAILIEAGFISNKKEAARLATEAYQNALAAAIANGIVDYIDGYQNGQSLRAN